MTQVTSEIDEDSNRRLFFRATATLVKDDDVSLKVRILKRTYKISSNLV